MQNINLLLTKITRSSQKQKNLRTVSNYKEKASLWSKIKILYHSVTATAQENMERS